MIFSLLASTLSASKSNGILSLLAVALLSVSSWTQTQSGTVLGTVTDTTGAVLPGVNITVFSPATGLKRETTTDVTGQYHLAGLPMGLFTVRLEKEGFRSELRQEVTLVSDVPIA